MNLPVFDFKSRTPAKWRQYLRQAGWTYRRGRGWYGGLCPGPLEWAAAVQFDWDGWRFAVLYEMVKDQ